MRCPLCCHHVATTDVTGQASPRGGRGVGVGAGAYACTALAARARLGRKTPRALAPQAGVPAPGALLSLGVQVLQQHPLPDRPSDPSKAGLRVLFSERSDITMPYNHTDLWDELQRMAPDVEFRSIRFEAVPVVRQLRLVPRRLCLPVSCEHSLFRGGGATPRVPGRKLTPPLPWSCVTFTLRVVVSTSQPGVFVMTASRALIRPSGEDAMGRSCILDAPPPPPTAVRMPACHSRRFKGERSIGAATG